MSTINFFYYNMYGVECEPKEACLVSEVKLTEPDLNFSKKTHSVQGFVNVGETINFTIGDPPRVIVGCRKDYYSQDYKRQYPSLWIQELDEGASFTQVFVYNGTRIWVNLSRVICF